MKPRLTAVIPHWPLDLHVREVRAAEVRLRDDHALINKEKGIAERGKAAMAAMSS